VYPKNRGLIYEIEDDLLKFIDAYGKAKVVPIPIQFVHDWERKIREVLATDKVLKEGQENA